MAGGFGLVVTFRLRSEEAATAFDALVARTLTGIRASEPGTLVYASHAVEGEPLVRVFYELYADRAAFDAHEEQPYTVAFLAARGEYVADFDVTFLRALDAKAPGTA